MPFAIREYQPTPNPNALKFVLDQAISAQPLSYLNPAAAENHALARQLFAITGVTSVFMLGDFVTINKSSDAKWPDIKRNVKLVLQNA